MENKEFWQQETWKKTKDECPHCGCKETFITMTLNGLVETGKAPKEAVPAYNRFTLVFQNPQTALSGSSVPYLVMLICGCAECHTMYFRSVEKRKGTMDLTKGGVIDAR
jgi:hypothetical protein